MIKTILANAVNYKRILVNIYSRLFTMVVIFICINIYIYSYLV